jgi:AcrR family transcriptional regulator
VTVAERRKQEREERRHLILDAAERVLYAKGLEAATMDDVASEARVGKGTLYLYFRNKDDLQWGVASRRQEALLQRFAVAHADAGDGLDELRRKLLAYAEHLSSPLEHLQMVLSCWVMGTHLRGDLPAAVEHRTQVRRTFSLLCSAVERGRRDGSIRPGPSAPQVALQLWSSVNGALLLHLQIAHLQSEYPLRELEPSLTAPTLAASVDGCLEGVRARQLDSTIEPAADSTPEPPAVVLGDIEDAAPSEPKAAAAGGDTEGGVQW